MSDLLETTQNNIDSKATDVSTDLKNSEDNTNPIVSSTSASLIQHVEPSNSASLIQQNIAPASNSASLIQQEPAPFEGKYNLDKFIKINNECKTEYRYYGEMKISGEDAPTNSNMILTIQFFFALQVLNWKTTSKKVLEIRQGEIFCNNWIFLTCFNEHDNSDRCSAIFIHLEWFQQNKVQLHKTALLDNILLNEGRADFMLICNIDNLLAMTSDSTNSPTDSLNIFNKTGALPKTVDDRFPLLKVLKGVIYNSTEIIGNYASAPEVKLPQPPLVASTPTIPLTTKPKGKNGGRDKGNTKQANELRQLAMRNNMFGNANHNIIQTPLNNNDLRIKRTVKKSVDPYQAVINEAAVANTRKAKLAANRKRKQAESKKDQSPPPLLRAVNNKPEDSAGAKEILLLKQQLNELRNSYQSSSVPPVAQEEAVVADDNNKMPQNKKYNAKRNKKSPTAVEESPVVEVSINESKEEEPAVIVSSNEPITRIVKKEKRKGNKKADKQNAMIISLLEKNNNELVQMKNRIHFLEGNNRQPPLSDVNRNTQSSQLIVSTPLIDKHFPSQNSTTNSSSNDRSNNDAYVPTIPHPNQAAVNPYYVQNPYFVQQQPHNNGWHVNTPQGMVMHPNGGMYVQQGNQDINRHFFDYAMLDYFSGRR